MKIIFIQEFLEIKLRPEFFISGFTGYFFSVLGLGRGGVKKAVNQQSVLNQGAISILI